MKRLLLVEDEDLLRESLTTLLRRRGFDVRSVRNGGEALALRSDFRADVLVTDWLLKDDLHGLDVARRLRSDNPDLSVVVITGLLSVEVRAEAEREPGVIAFMEKPFLFSQLAEALGRVDPS